MTTPLYNPKVPESPDDALADSQVDFLADFQALYNAFLVNHVPLDTATIGGNHNLVQLLQQQNSQQTNTGEISVYTKNVPDQTNQIFLRYQGNGTEFQFTNYQLYTLVQTPKLEQHFTFLPGKVIVYYGKFILAKEKKYTLNLLPTIAKNIITMSFCPIDSTDSQTLKPRATITAKNAKGFIPSIVLNGSTATKNDYVRSNYYIVIANL